MQDNPYRSPREQGGPSEQSDEDSAAGDRTRLRWVLKTTVSAVCIYALMYAWDSANGKKPQSARLAAVVLVTVFAIEGALWIVRRFGLNARRD